MTASGQIAFTFRHRSYPDAEQNALRDAVADLIPVELSPQQIPEAGGSAEIWAFLSSPAGWPVSALISGIAYDGLKSIATRLATWWQQYRQRSQFGIGPELCAFSFELAGVTYEFVDGRHDESPDAHFMSAPHLANLPDALAQVLFALPPQRLVANNITNVRIPYFAGETAFESEGWFLGRYWEARATQGDKLLYDSTTGAIAYAPAKALK